MGKKDTAPRQARQSGREQMNARQSQCLSRSLPSRFLISALMAKKRTDTRWSGLSFCPGVSVADAVRKRSQTDTPPVSSSLNRF